MKLIFAVLLASLPVLASDIRTIGGKKVDLQPIHDWNAAKAASGSDTKAAKTLGERPLMHWKELTVLEYVESLGNPVVVVKLDGGATNTIMLKNCPPALLTKFMRRQSLVRQLKAARINATSAKTNAEAKANQHKAAARHARYAEAGSPADHDDTRTFWASHDAYEFARESKENMEAIEEEIETLSLAIKSEDKVLAMPTGATYATFPFWDTGITAR